ncbi:tumor necrosis factor receptor superfamily member 1B [Scomber japonicus]|uniref:tumor necrosis factor receptor superfamily member 1B n=1 Tax=Scomber japonicus TaxID=13676 RepID=UPI0023067B7C|nr:tumor necrosis factor receptor superfamily member 1B [Scomber japonicus]
MKDILILLVLLNAHTIKVWSVPYQVDSDENCRSEEVYKVAKHGLCCKKCPPGQRLKNECNGTTDTECEPCPSGQYSEGWNYSPKCFRCTQCKSIKGLQYANNCSLTRNSRCICKTGRYCLMGYEDPFCTDCVKYTECKAGFGVSTPGTPSSNVRCTQCTDGTFSDTISYMDSCRPHTNCNGVAVVRNGDSFSDTVCKSMNLHTTASPATSTIVSTTSNSTPSHGWTDSAFIMSSTLEAILTYPTTSPPPSRETDNKLVPVIVSVSGLFLILIFIIILVTLRKLTRRKDTARLHPKVDANGNCESGDGINHLYAGKTQMTSFTITSPEQQCLLEKGEVSNDHSQCSSNTETLTRTDGYSSHESISPLQSTLALHNPHSALSEPMTLLSNIEPITPQPSISTQSSSQPTSPQIISPVTPNPQVSVNITFHIGNGTCGTPSVIQTDPILPFGEEEELYSIPQQEAGKQSLMSTQESASYSM